MGNFYNRYIYHRISIWITLLTFIAGQIHADEMCNFCQGPAHLSKYEKCLRCGKMIMNCDYVHDMREINADDILNASSIDALTDILFILQEKSSISFQAIFDKADKFYLDKGIHIPDNSLKEAKKMILTKGFNDNRAKHDANDTFGYRYACKAQTIQEPECPYKLRYGFMLTWCGVALTCGSDGLLAGPGLFVMTIGASWTIEGTFEYEENKRQFEIEKAEKARLQAEENARIALEKAEKEERRRLKEIERQKEKNEKEERRRLKEIERQKEKEEKEERRRLKDERLKLQEEQKKQ